MFIGAENIISPLGDTAKITFERMFLGDISIQKQNNISISTFNYSDIDLFLSNGIKSFSTTAWY